MNKIMVFLAIVVFQFLAFVPQLGATCMSYCDFQLADLECNAKTLFETDDRINIFGSCHVKCCSPPAPPYFHGSCGRSESSLDHSLTLYDANRQRIKIFFYESGISCNGQPLLRADRGLDAGSYTLSAHGGSGRGTFEVVPDTDHSSGFVGIAAVILFSLLLM